MKNDIMPPEQDGIQPAAAETTSQSVQTIDSQPNLAEANTAQPIHKRWFAKLKSLTAKQRIIALVVIGVLLIGVTYAGIMAFHKTPKVTPVMIKPKVVPPKPTTEASRLTGVQISPELNKLPVTGIMIENSPDARPQSGLNVADIVFEAVAEGGITRFLTLFLEDQPDYIGPVRSVRPYYLDFLVPFDAAIAHAGGSGEALAQISSEGIKDLDHGANGGTYQRVSSRFAPHNLYTSMAQLLELQKSKGFTSSTFTSFARKDKDSPLATPTASSIDFSLSAPLYNPHFDYDKATNSYLRSEAGRPHIDEKSGAQIAPKVVIALITSRGQNGIYSVYQTTGKGSILVFQDGGVIEGTWEKADRKGQLTFKTTDSKLLKLNPGRTWITLVTPDSAKYTP